VSARKWIHKYFLNEWVDQRTCAGLWLVGKTHVLCPACFNILMSFGAERTARTYGKTYGKIVK
jgi:hypothetical protein